MRPRPVTRSLARPCALAVLALASCTTTRTVHPGELARLDGFSAAAALQAQRPIASLDGGAIMFTPSTTLSLDLPGYRASGRFASIRVQDGVFDGRTKDGTTVRAPVDEISGVTLEEPDPLRTTLLVVVLGFVVAGLAVGFVLPRVAPRASEGRALRIGGKLVTAPIAVADGWRVDDLKPDVGRLSAEARETLAVAWSRSARAEHASVPAFARLSLTLVALGAPARLIEAAHRAALDEIQHARLAYALAEAYAGVPVAPGPIAELAGAPATTAPDLIELAAESLVDGCLLEGVAAAVAADAATRAKDPAVRRAFALIARDETRHAELAWAVVDWCCDHTDGGLRRRLRRSLAHVPATVSPPLAPAHLASELAPHGWLDPATWQSHFERTRALTASRLAHDLRVT